MKAIYLRISEKHWMETKKIVMQTLKTIYYYKFLADYPLSTQMNENKLAREESRWGKKTNNSK